MSSSYAWIIDTDHLADAGEEPGTLAGNAATITGPDDAPARLLARLRDGDGIEFRMFDGDGILYYSGRFVPADLSGTEAGFGPLNDFGAPNGGAVTIRYRNGGRWETL